jgi:hypothetical protein
MRQIFPVIIFVLFVIADVNGQSSYKFHSQNYIGILNGESATKFQVQSINGFERGTWFGGLGTGLDYYYFRSVPVFLSFNKSFCSCERSFFVSLDGGINWIWDKSTSNRINNFRDGDFSPSWYWAGGVGYKIGLKNKRDAVLLNVGYSTKVLKERIVNFIRCQFPPCPQDSEWYKYTFRRLSLKAGWRF